MFSRRVAASDDPVRIAQTAILIWGEVGAALAPIIGAPGVAALFKRSVHLARVAHPCLYAVSESALPGSELATLQTVLAQQERSEALAINAALLQHFHDVLITLIGASLTERLLRPVGDTPSSGDAVPEAKT